jgi:hypothetical protein
LPKNADQFAPATFVHSLQETTMPNASTMAMLLLSVLHLMAMLLLSWANLLLLPRSSSDGHKQKVSDGKY